MTISPYALTSLSKVHAELPNLEGTAEEDDRLIELINSVTALIESVVDRRLVSRTYTSFLLSGNARYSPSVMAFPEWPLTAVSAITIKPASLLVAEQVVLVSGEDWTFNNAGLMYLIDGDEFVLGVNNIEVTATAGYLTTHPLWPILEKACVDTVKHEWAKAKNPQDMVLSISDPGGSVSYFQGPLLPQVRMVLENTFKRQDI